MPFTLQPAVKNDFINREDILKEMLSTLQDENVRMGYALVGPRRIGKTSILKEVIRRLEQKKKSYIVPVYFSVWDLVENTLPEFCTRITLSIIEAFKPHLSLKLKIKELLKVPGLKFFEVLRSLDIKVSIFDEIEVALKMGKSGEIDHNTLLEKLFSFGEKMAKENGVRLILMIDEFPSIMDIKNKTKLGVGIIKKIRTIYEDLQHTVICVTGSIRRTMEIAILAPSSAFYRQFIVKRIGPFNHKSTKEIIERNIDKKISEKALIKLHEITGGIPFYLQFLGRALEKHSSKRLNLETINALFDEFLFQEADILFSEQIKSFSDKEKMLISRMAYEDLTTAAEIKKSIGESSNVISRYMDYFLIKGVLEKEKKGRYHFTDPVFKEWVKNRLAPTNL